MQQDLATIGTMLHITYKLFVLVCLETTGAESQGYGSFHEVCLCNIYEFKNCPSSQKYLRLRSSVYIVQVYMCFDIICLLTEYFCTNIWLITLKY